MAELAYNDEASCGAPPPPVRRDSGVPPRTRSQPVGQRWHPLAPPVGCGIGPVAVGAGGRPGGAGRSALTLAGPHGRERGEHHPCDHDADQRGDTDEQQGREQRHGPVDGDRDAEVQRLLARVVDERVPVALGEPDRKRSDDRAEGHDEAREGGQVRGHRGAASLPADLAGVGDPGSLGRCDAGPAVRAGSCLPVECRRAVGAGSVHGVSFVCAPLGARAGTPSTIELASARVVGRGATPVVGYRE